MHRRIGSGARLVSVLLLCVAAGCSTPETERIVPRDAQAGPTATGNAPPATGPRADAAQVEFALSLGTPAPAAGTTRRLRVSWSERLLRAADGSPLELRILPLRFQAIVNDGQGARAADPAFTAAIRCWRRATDPIDRTMAVEAAAEPPATAIASTRPSELSLWNSTLPLLLLIEELAYVVLPASSDRAAPEWRIELDSTGFARRTRLGAWFETGLSARAKQTAQLWTSRLLGVRPSGPRPQASVDPRKHKVILAWALTPLDPSPRSNVKSERGIRSRQDIREQRLRGQMDPTPNLTLLPLGTNFGRLAPNGAGPTRARDFERMHTDEHNPMELIGGWVVPMCPGDFDAGRALAKLSALLLSMATDRGWELSLDARHELRAPPDTIVFPDIAVHAAGSVPYILDTRTIGRIPDLVVEILGENTYERDIAPRGAKFLAYQMSGVREYYYAWPDGRDAAGFALRDGLFVPLPQDLDGFFASPLLGRSLRFGANPKVR
ncbi:MAG: Uma2 family endonuclease [Planctomycetes bacterium]|nr:Uma2 family endonuclease [Planctomycetota bacterium]